MKPIYKYFITIILTALVVALIPRCDQKTSYIIPKVDTGAIKKQIQKTAEERAFLLSLAKEKDSTRVEYITKWRVIRKTVHDTIINRDSVIKLVQVGDSVIYQDSVQISLLRKANQKADTIIAGQAKVIQADSVRILGLKKEVRRQKWQKRGILALWILREGVGAVSH